MAKISVTQFGLRYVLEIYRRLPVSFRWRKALKDALFLTAERYIFDTNLYQGWRHQRLVDKSAFQALETELSRLPLAPTPRAPSDAMWDEVSALVAKNTASTNAATSAAANAAHTAPLVDVIFPVYRGLDETLNALYHVLKSQNRTPYALIVINDASPDIRLTQSLRNLAARGLFTLLENTENLGFVATVNRGMALHAERDVVLLNSDTEVYNDWLDRLRAHATNKPAIASVTPLSNNAEIASYPLTLKDNTMQLECDFPALDGLAAAANAGQSVPVPTGVGFCMYITRASLERVGLFDVERFGKGYGEENEFCLRASAAGFTHVLAGDVFVRHVGGTSFGAEKQARIARAMQVIRQLYPHYEHAVQHWIAGDRGRTLRRNIDIARTAQHVRTQRVASPANATPPAMLMVTHRLGGGTEKHVQDMATRLRAEGWVVYFLRPHSEYPHRVVLEASGPECCPNLYFDVHYEADDLQRAFAALNVRHVHVHHLIFFDVLFKERLVSITRALDVPMDVTLHDYLPVCPRINLIDHSGVYCGEPELLACERCVERNSSPVGHVPVWKWRESHAAWLQAARRVYVPHVDVAARFERYFPSVTFTVRPHFETLPTVDAALAAPHATGTVRRFAIIGGLGHHKGSRLVEALVRDIAARNLPLHFVLFGEAENYFALRRYSGITILGEYKEQDIFDLLAHEKVHAAFLASLWPETYSYTLSIAQAARIKPVVFDLGALAARVRESGFGEVLPRALMQDPAALNDALLALPLSATASAHASDAPFTPAFATYATLTEAYYGLSQAELQQVRAA